MIMVKHIASFLLLVLLLSGCIEPVDLETKAGEKLLVVEGMITSLSKTSAYGLSPYDTDPSVLDAVVTISDDQGNSEVLQPGKDGIYTTAANGIQGQAGRWYSLQIITKDGREYRSKPQLLRPVPVIDSIYIEYKVKKVLNSYNTVVDKRGIDIKVLTQDPTAEENYYRWRYKGTYRVVTQPGNYYEHTSPTDSVWAPKDCCNTCWISDFNRSVTVAADRQVNGNILKQTIVWVPTISLTFSFKYHIAIEQYSLSAEEYDFWAMLETQTSGNGTIQDTPPARIKGKCG
jgi:hypothetical protein